MHLEVLKKEGDQLQDQEQYLIENIVLKTWQGFILGAILFKTYFPSRFTLHLLFVLLSFLMRAKITIQDGCNIGLDAPPLLMTVSKFLANLCHFYNFVLPASQTLMTAKYSRQNFCCGKVKKGQEKHFGRLSHNFLCDHLLLDVILADCNKLLYLSDLFDGRISYSALQPISARFPSAAARS